MTISIWRYSHLALAVSSFLFIALAAVTGIILAFEPVADKFPSYRSADFNQVSVAQAIPALKKNFAEVTEVSINHNQFVLVKGTDTTDEMVEVYVDPANGDILGMPAKQSAFFQWVTALHRSLFLHAAGRFFVGLASFLLLLITVSGAMLIIQRQRGVKRFFSRIVKENFAQYFHVVLGRLSLIPIFIIAASGTWLSLVTFELIPEKKINHPIDFDAVKSGPEMNPERFPLFQNLPLSSVKSIEYPFSDDPEDYYLLKLQDREIVVNQFTGEQLSEVLYPTSALITSVSLDLHTGRKSILWALLLAAASVNILFFIYSGFVIWRKRTASRMRNSTRPGESQFIILVGSENGTTLRFANLLQQQLVSNGRSSYITELNNYRVFPKATHLIVLTATYGLGDAPSNANKFTSLLQKYPQLQQVQFSVLGFGSHAYPDYCRFAFEVHNALANQSWAVPLLDIHTVNDKSPAQFSQWFATWSQKLNLPQASLPAEFNSRPTGLVSMSVTGKTVISHTAGNFLITFQPSRWARFTSGDLLAIYPANDYRERLYSIGRIGKTIQLSVKLHPDGLGSEYLYRLRTGDRIQARIMANEHFQFPQKAPAVIMISNGTGIGPFVGMIDQNTQRTPCYLYSGFREAGSFNLFRAAMQQHVETQQLKQFNIAYSREGEKQYVSDLLKRDAAFIAEILTRQGVLMICGSLAMEHDVIALLEDICKEHTKNTLSFYQSHAQVLSDCY